MLLSKLHCPTLQRFSIIIAILSVFSLIIAIPGPASETGNLNESPPEKPAIEFVEPPIGVMSPIPVTIDRQGDGYQLNRGGLPYFIKGVGGRKYLDLAAAAGANSVRTWGAHDAGNLLERAQDRGMTVMLGIWLSHNPLDYYDGEYKSSKREEIQRLLDDHKNHPALLMWSIGNEINLQGANTPEAWQFVNELACQIKTQDPNHPVISVIAFDGSALETIAAYAPDLDAVGINAYGALSSVRTVIDSTTYKGPYIITEWGVKGHWEAKHTIWGRPIEPTSAQKADYCLQHYKENILANGDRCVGSYVFLWGQKQERTPTWYSMFIENLPGIDLPNAACPTVDVMRFNWLGSWPTNLAPKVDEVTINGVMAADDVKLMPGEPFLAQVTAADPENDGLRYVWELMEEPTVLGIGGSYEPKPGVMGNTMDGNFPELNLIAPEKAGEYRLFVYVLDQNGHVGTANIPFRVELPPAQDVAASQPVASNG